MSQMFDLEEMIFKIHIIIMFKNENAVIQYNK